MALATGDRHATDHVSVVAQTAAMSWRAVLAMLRQPALAVPALAFPLLFVAINTSALGETTGLPGFPDVESFLDFALAGALVQGVLFGSVMGATALAADIESGFFDRLLVCPTARSSILVGRLAGAMAYGSAQTLFFVAVLVPFGLTVASGVGGVLVLACSGALTALAAGGIMSAMALRTGSSDAVQSAFPLMFILLFFSSAFFPRQLMDGAYATVADLNPISHLVEGCRGLVIDGVEPGHVARALGIPGGLALVTVTVALRSLAKRVAGR